MWWFFVLIVKAMHFEEIINKKTKTSSKHI